MTPPDPEVLASRWRLDDLLAGSRQVEVHAATDTELGAEVVTVLWSEDPGPSGREVNDGDVVLVDAGVHDGIWFATYGRADGVPLTPAAKAALARRFVPDEGAAAPVAPPPVAPRRRGLAAAGVAGLLLLVAVGGVLLGQSPDADGRNDDVEPRAAEEEPIQEPLREALRDLRTAAGAEGRAEVAVVEEAVVRRDWPAVEQALDRVVRRDRGTSDGLPGRLAIAAARVRAALPVPGRAPEEVSEEEPVVTPCEPTTTTSPGPTSSTSSTSSSSTSSTTTIAADAGATTTTLLCAPTSTVVAGPSTSTTTTVPSSSTTSTTSQPSTTTSMDPSTATTTATTDAPRRRRKA